MKKKEMGEITIRGLVIPADWDEDDHVTRVVIESTYEEEYLVEQNKKGEELLSFLRHKVEVTGTVRGDEFGELHINVNGFRSMEDADENKEAYAQHLH